MNKDREQIIIVRKKKVHGHAHHGGAWKVAFADFMTAMFALFLVLWLVNQSSDVKAAVAGYFQDPLGRSHEAGSSIVPGQGAQVAPPKPESKLVMTEMRKQELKKLQAQIEEEIANNADFAALTKHFQIEMTDEGLRIELIEDSTGVFFEQGSAQPRPKVVDFLRLLGNQLATLPNGVMVDGYTDAVPYAIGKSYGNWELSADRANTARRTMVEGGLASGQVRGVRGHADQDLRDPAHPTSASNRRVTITMLFTRADDGETRDTLGGTVAVP